jgi:hypothetical protein
MGSSSLQAVKKDWSLLRHAQHERILVDSFKTHPVRHFDKLSAGSEHGRRTPNRFSTFCLFLTLLVAALWTAGRLRHNNHYDLLRAHDGIIGECRTQVAA